MRSIRNPRFAPEFLERKLSPSDLGISVVADVAPATTGSTSFVVDMSTDTTVAADCPLPPVPPYEPPGLPPVDPGCPPPPVSVATI